MKGIVFSLIALGGAVAAQAVTNFNFSPATDGTYTCPSYCRGFVTDDPSHAVDFVNIQIGSLYAGPNQYKITIRVDGNYYQGYTSGTGAPFQAQGIVVSPTTGITYTGAMIGVTVNWISKTTCRHSGRVQGCTTWNSATTGRVSLP